ncbi:O-methyltransferase family protein, C-terminal part [Listeria fleischmannii FSL S10-1203]|uniref:O-methyltransferase family protein, C-terminal part n=1 Tax=Listeria fleischmannii FSL S10-1203 TaxID=1265822 RepID=W7DN79_9LIST|nr:O-methyltransferase family protein, C-terminal part [Listeria fleischmannii FSL S10-1203]
MLPDAEIITIERDEERYQLAISNFERYGENHVESVYGDALLDADKLVSKGPYDAIFIDAAKAQYEKFFQIYTEVLSQEGVLYSDNVLFKGLALDEPDEVKKKGACCS